MTWLKLVAEMQATREVKQPLQSHQASAILLVREANKLQEYHELEYGGRCVHQRSLAVESFGFVYRHQKYESITEYTHMLANSLFGLLGSSATFRGLFEGSRFGE